MAFVFYDTETTGTDTKFDQILQFGAIRTDTELRELERFEIRCRLLPHVVPSPGAMRVTGITAAQLIDPALPSHYEMMRRIQAKLVEWSPATFIGYNSLTFDEHLLRQALYKTLHPPYLTNRPGNGRCDAMRVVQASSLFAATALILPSDSRGKTTFRLDQVAPTNGFNHVAAHDAMGDVEATIHLCRLLMERAPEVWSSAMRFSLKAATMDFVVNESVFCLSDFYFGKPYSWLVTPIGHNAENPAEIHVFDLATDPSTLADLSEQQLIARLRRSPKPVRRLKANGGPMIVATEDAPSIAAARTLSSEEIERRAGHLAADENLRQRLLIAFEATKEVRELSPHVEARIYESFTSDTDHAHMVRFHDTPWEGRQAILAQLVDVRMRELGDRLIHTERPDVLADDARSSHDRLIAQRVLAADGDVPWLTVHKAIEEVEDLLRQSSGADQTLLREHRDYLLQTRETAAELI